jgi:phosphoglycerate kinase
LIDNSRFTKYDSPVTVTVAERNCPEVFIKRESKGKKLTVKDIALKNKRVLMRVDINVTLDKEGNITDDTRIKASLPTIRYILKQGASLILMSHLGRPKGKVVEKLRMDVVARRLEKLLGKTVLKLDECVGSEAKKKAKEMKPSEVMLLENTRFHKEETDNEPQFAKKLASLADVFVNDAFGAAHRAHASTVGVARFLPSAAGFLMGKELEVLGGILANPQAPFVAILGGAKVSDKIGVLLNLLDKCEDILIGGGMAYTFLKAKGFPVGKSLLEEEKILEAKNIIDKAFEKKCNILLPLDHLVAKEAKRGVEVKIVGQDKIPFDWLALDIGPETLKLFAGPIKKARTIFWNGPMGMFEIEDFAKGTETIAKMLAECDATVVVGGGDSIAAIRSIGLEDKMNHISTGGGASLEFLEGKELPGVAVLNSS